jgi:hypothetical protein
VDLSTVTKVLDDQIETDVFSKSKLSELNNLDKVEKLKTYKYKSIYMDNYGEKVLDKNNNLIGYKLNDSEYATLLTFIMKINLYVIKY